MLVIAFIGVFIVGAIAGIAGMFGIAYYFTRMSMDEFSDVGSMMIDAGQNRECDMILTKDDEAISKIVFKER